jgi:amino-acid N-acetyltransferase
VIFTEFASKPWTGTELGVSSSITKLPAADVVRLESLLLQNQLPSQDCVAQAEHFFGLYQEQKLVAAGGLEPAGQFALLRSVVVLSACRAQGLGAMMTEFLIHKAVTQNYESLYLLTESAETYFLKFGFTLVARDQVPDEIAATQQFSSLCPDSAHCMVLKLSQ